MVVVKSVMKTVVLMVISIISAKMKRAMAIEFLQCRTDLNFEVDFGVNCTIGTIVTKWDLIVFG